LASKTQRLRWLRAALRQPGGKVAQPNPERAQSARLLVPVLAE
jgi:hypothetical protein